MLDAPVLEIEIRPGQAHDVTLALAGELDLSSCPTLRTCMEELDPSIRHVVVDLTDLGFIDSTGIALLLGFDRTFKADLKQFTVRCPPGSIRRVLQMSGADTRLTLVG